MERPRGRPVGLKFDRDKQVSRRNTPFRGLHVRKSIVQQGIVERTGCSIGVNSHKIIGGNPSMVIPLLANQDLTHMLLDVLLGGSIVTN